MSLFFFFFFVIFCYVCSYFLRLASYELQVFRMYALVKHGVFPELHIAPINTEADSSLSLARVSLIRKIQLRRMLKVKKFGVINFRVRYYVYIHVTPWKIRKPIARNTPRSNGIDRCASVKVKLIFSFNTSEYHMNICIYKYA